MVTSLLYGLRSWCAGKHWKATERADVLGLLLIVSGKGEETPGPSGGGVAQDWGTMANAGQSRVSQCP